MLMIQRVIKDVRSLTKLFECVHVYELGSGAKLSRSKTEAMWLGAWMSRADEPLDLTWVKKNESPWSCFWYCLM